VAENAIQEIVIKTVAKLKAFEGKSFLRAWLYRIA
jgi:DNA-directed RNA polymerase specialized sigma24 family protein